MNNMGSSTNLNRNNAGGGYEPAIGNLTASERAAINSLNRNYYYNDTSLGHGCGNNSWISSNMNNQNTTMPMQIKSRNLNGSQIGPAENWNSLPNNTMQTGMNNNMNTVVRPATTASQSISFTPETLTNMSFLPAYLSQFIGHWIRADFFIGDTIERRVGVLHEVGASYFILEAIEPQTLLVCDMFSVKFVTIILDDDLSRLARF